MARPRMDIRKFGDILRPVVGGQSNQVEMSDMTVEAPQAEIPYSRAAAAYSGTKAKDRIEAANMASGQFESKATTADDYAYRDANTGEVIDISGLVDKDNNPLEAYIPNATASADQLRTNNQVKVVNQYGDELNAYYVDVQAKDAETGQTINLQKKMYRNVDEFYGDENALKEAGYSTLKRNYMKFGFNERDAQKLVDQAKLMQNDKTKTFNKGLSNFQIKRLQAEALNKAFEWQGENDNQTLRLKTSDPVSELKRLTTEADERLGKFTFKDANGVTRNGMDFLNLEVLYGTRLFKQNLKDVHLTNLTEGKVATKMEEAKEQFRKKNPDKIIEGNKGFEILSGALTTQEESEVESSATDVTGITSTKNNVLVLHTFNKVNAQEIIDTKNGEAATRLLIDAGFIDPTRLAYDNESEKQAIDAGSIELLKTINESVEELRAAVEVTLEAGQYSQVLEEYNTWYSANSRILRDEERKVDNILGNFNAENSNYFNKLNKMDQQGKFFNPDYDDSFTGKIYNNPQEMVDELDKKYSTNPIEYLAQVKSLQDAGVITNEAAAMLGTRARYLEVRLGATIPEIKKLRDRLGLKSRIEIPEDVEVENQTGLKFKGQTYAVNTSFNKKTGKYEPYAFTGEANPKFANRLNFGMSANKIYVNHQDVLDDKFPGEAKLKFAEIIINRANGNEDDIAFIKKNFNLDDEQYDSLGLKDMTPAELVEILDEARDNVNNTKFSKGRVVKALKKGITSLTEEAKETLDDPTGLRRAFRAGRDVIKKGLEERARVKEETGKPPILPGTQPGGGIDYMRELFKRRSN